MRTIALHSLLVLTLTALLLLVPSSYAEPSHPHAGDTTPPPSKPLLSVEEEEEKQSAAAMIEARSSQSEVDRVTEEMMRRLTELELEYHKKKMPLFQKRNEILKKVKGFWQRVVENHPGHGAWLRGADKEILRYLVDVDVIEMEAGDQHEGSSYADLHLLHNFRLAFTFSPNEFFSNMVLWRDVRGHAHDDNLVVSGITWFEGRAPSDVSFFNFFEHPQVRAGPRLESHVVAEIGHVFRYELWPNPFTYHDLSRYHELLQQSQDGTHYFAHQEVEGEPYDGIEDHEVVREEVEADPILPEVDEASLLEEATGDDSAAAAEQQEAAPIVDEKVAPVADEKETATPAAGVSAEL